jgi:hypothetical protein
LKRYKSPGSDQIPAELVLAGGEILRSKFHRFHQVKEDEVGRACSTNGGTRGMSIGYLSETRRKEITGKTEA